MYCWVCTFQLRLKVLLILMIIEVLLRIKSYQLLLGALLGVPFWIKAESPLNFIYDQSPYPNQI